MDLKHLTWQSIADSLSDSIFMVKEDATIFYVNQFACDKLGYTQDELTQMTVMQIGAPYQGNQWKDAWERFRNEGVVRFESKHRHRDGHEYPVLISTNYNDGSHDFPFVIAHVQDISETVFNRQRLQLAAKSAGLGFWDMELSTRQVYVSPELVRQLGQDVGTQWSVEVWMDLLHPDDLESSIKHLEDFQAGLIDEYANTYRLRHTDGSYRWIETRGAYLKNDAGEVLRFMGTHLDVTEQQHIEQELRRTLHESESVKRSLTRSNQDLEQFAYVASHDLRAPLRGLKHLTDWVKEDAEEAEIELPDSVMDHLTKMRAQVNRMDSLLAGLLEYSRVGQRRQMERETDLADVIADAIEMATLPEGFQVIAPESSPTWNTVREILLRVFQNLIDNAIKHHDRESGTIRIEYIENENDFVFSVIDDGPGIESKFHEKVFKIFQTLQNNSSEESTSGLGLTIVNKLLQTVGGSIEIHNAEPRGAEFRFRWPKQLDYDNASVPDNLPT